MKLETAINANGAPWPREGIHDRMHPWHVDCPRAAGIDACTLANNYVFDWGRLDILPFQRRRRHLAPETRGPRLARIHAARHRPTAAACHRQHGVVPDLRLTITGARTEPQEPDFSQRRHELRSRTAG